MLHLLVLCSLALADPTWDRLWSAAHPPALTPWFTHDLREWDTAVADTLRPIVVDSGVYVDGPWNNRTLVRVRGSRVTGPSGLHQNTVVATSGPVATVLRDQGTAVKYRREDGQDLDTGTATLVTYHLPLQGIWALQQYEGWVPVLPVPTSTLLLRGNDDDDGDASAPVNAQVQWVSPNSQQITVKNPMDGNKAVTLELLPIPSYKKKTSFSGYQRGMNIPISTQGGTFYVTLKWGPGPDDWDGYETKVIASKELSADGESTPTLRGGVSTPPVVTWLTQVSEDGRTVSTASGLTLTKQDDTPFDTPHHARFFQLREQDSPLPPELQQVLDHCLRDPDNGCLDIGELWHAGKAIDVVRLAAGKGQHGQWLVTAPSKALSWLSDQDAHWKQRVAAAVAAWQAECQRDPSALDTAPVSCSELREAVDQAKVLGLRMPGAAAPLSDDPPAPAPWVIAVIIIAVVVVIGIVVSLVTSRSKE